MIDIRRQRTMVLSSLDLGEGGMARCEVHNSC
jgi:hypothetical protein